VDEVTAAVGALIVPEDGLGIVAGAAGFAAGAMTVSEDGMTVSAGAVAAEVWVAASLRA
jgi:hypothetical protein